MAELLSVLQGIMQDNQSALKPTELAFGTVVSVSPLSIQVEGSKQPKPEAAFILTDSVMARSANVQGGDGGSVVINRGLAVGDRVTMLRVLKGQRYIVLSKAQ